MENPEL
jgi:hypothetical protein